MEVQIALLFLSQLLVPLFFIYTLWKDRDTSGFGWLIKLLYMGAFIVYIFLAGSWHWTVYYLRYVILALFIVAAVVSYRRARGLPFFANRGWALLRSNLGGLLVLLLFAFNLGWAVYGFFYFEAPVRLAFPLRDGWYYVGHGGNSTRLNYHNVSPSQQYAVDVVALNPLGLRAEGLLPTELERYVIFGDPLYSPCDGQVIEAVDGLPDLTPPQMDSENLAGNHLIIECQGVHVVMAHMQNGSLLVGEGDTLTTGQPLGRVGNSGNTSEPHLHIHAIRAGSGDIMTGDGVPILFDGVFPTRNTTY